MSRGVFLKELDGLNLTFKCERKAKSNPGGAVTVLCKLETLSVPKGRQIPLKQERGRKL